MVDAEHTYYQPALDAYTLMLSEEFNRPPNVVRRKSDGSVVERTAHLVCHYLMIDAERSITSDSGTYQSYLTRQPQHLDYAIRHAEQNDYALGIKLVRGAYFVQERKTWAKEKRAGADPIWPEYVGAYFSFRANPCIVNREQTILTTRQSRLFSPPCRDNSLPRSPSWH